MTYPKLISWSYRDGLGLFSSKNDKEFINLFYVRNAETEETIKKVGFIPSDALGPDFPGVYRQKEWGYSQRARSHGKIKKKFQKLYPDLEDKFLCKQANTGENLNGAICARLCVDSWVNPLTKEYPEYFLSSKYIKASAFDDTKFVEDLLNYKPLALGSGVIKSYQEEELPNFVQSVKFYNQNLYKKLLSFDKVQELSKEFSPVGKTAKVHTLKPSKVWPLKDLFDYSINKSYFWDGEKIIITFSNKSQELTNIDTLTFTPKEDYLVEIIEEDSVTPMTEFVQPKK